MEIRPPDVAILTSRSVVQWREAVKAHSNFAKRSLSVLSNVSIKRVEAHGLERLALVEADTLERQGSSDMANRSFLSGWSGVPMGTTPPRRKHLTKPA